MTPCKQTLSIALLAACQMTMAQQPAADTPTSEPRIIRGDDRVVGETKPAPALAGSPISLNFEEAPIAEVARTILGDLLRVDYVLYPPINGTVTLSTRAPVSPDQAVFLLEGALFANGMTLMRDARGSYHVGRPEALKGISGGIRRAVNGSPLPPGSGAIIVPLQYIGASEMAAILRPMLPLDSLIRVDTVRNLLILAGTRAQAEGWLDLVSTFDVNLLKGMSVGVFPLKYASVQEIEAALQLMSGSAAAAAGGSAATAVPRTTPTPANAAAGTAARPPVSLGENSPLFGALRIMPIERINSILVVTPRAAYLDEARRWIERFDRPSDGGAEPQLNIYRVQNGNARHLAGVLQGIFGGAPAGTATGSSGVAPGLAAVTGAAGGYPYGGGGAFGNSPFQNSFGNRGTGFGGTGTFGSSFGGGGIGGGINSSALGARTQQGIGGQQMAPVTATIGNVRVMSDDLNNSILVWSTRGEFEKIEATLKRLDIPPTQVLIEASIIEVSLNDNLNYGLQWAFDGGVGSNYQGSGQISSGTGAVASGIGSLGTAAAQGFTYSLVNSAGKIRMALNALAKKTTIKMISNPSLMVLDNHLAMMTVGNQVPVETAVTYYPNSGTNTTTSTVQYRDTGVSLAVTPSVNSGNLVSMQIDQTVTDVSDTTTSSTNSQPTFMQRQISSKVAVRSGESIVLGGLIKDNETRGKNGVPVLQDLPLIGNLFGTNTRGGARTELLVVITPKVVRNDIDVREISDELRDRMKGLLDISPSSAIKAPPQQHLGNSDPLKAPAP